MAVVDRIAGKTTEEVGKAEDPGGVVGVLADPTDVTASFWPFTQ